MTGSEPILTPDGERIVDRKGRPSYVTSAGAGPSVGKYLLLAYLPPEHAVVGTTSRVMYMDERLPGAGGGRRQHAAVRPRRRPDEVLTAMAAETASASSSASSGSPRRVPASR